ncbi:UvrD-helicase domain-containing protein [Phycicoccus sp. Root101]|uniref:UvrD-helicase domain-containing protein n=1 Tax=Phycicoccus sp. Root101 TaxID=1736421 RepID=UPI00070338F3|nr:ATP-dependent helicase [Phycicoccus sp. Root101]KQU67957.1 ATP-dependent DNA helicase PcrA [Phycicoccus sp. Root101]
MKTPTPAQAEVRDHESLALLLVAPAGCGKTEALAIRVAGLIEAQRVARPRRILVTTFTNRAKDNLRERLREYVPLATQREYVTVANFHGFATRVIRAHGAVIGIDPGLEMPDSDWVTERCFELGIGWGGKDAVTEIFRVVKQLPSTDVQVAAELAARGNKWAIQIEHERLAANRATYDDLLRYAELILANDAVAGLYRSHFGAVIVDEYQDLTPQQLRVLQRLSDGNITFAGDLAQGIYRFAGATPTEIDALMRPLCEHVITFNESHRSSPAVLDMVNAMNPLTGGEDLTSADPSRWPAGGLAGAMTFPHATSEANWVVRAARLILKLAPNHRIAVMSRIKSRVRFVEAELGGTDVPVHRWEDGMLDTETANIVKSTLTRLNVADLGLATDKLTFLRELAGIDLIDEYDTRRNLVDALTWTLERLGEGLHPDRIAERIRVGDQTTLIKAPGIHLLSGHVGKGQQFDWVFIVGAEDDNMPFFRAHNSDVELEEEARILGVMLSRARHGVVVTYSEVVPKVDGHDKSRAVSRFVAQLGPASPRDRDGVIRWLNDAPWDDLRVT